MARNRSATIPAWGRPESRRGGRDRELRGIVITDGGQGAGAFLRPPRIAAFIWGERDDAQPTLPFGRWKQAS